MILKNNLKIINKDFRNYYRNVTKNDKKIRLHEYDNDRIIQLFTKKVAKNIIESKSGVHIKRLGYFYNHRIPWIIFPIKTKKHAYKYITSFIPTDNSILKYWSFDFMFLPSIEKEIKSKIKNGYGYLNMVKGLSKTNNYYLGAPYRSRLQSKIEKIKNDI